MAAVIVVLWGWLTNEIVGVDRFAMAHGLLAGLALDVAIRIGFLSLDLPWNNGAAAAVVAVAISVVLIASAVIGLNRIVEPWRTRGLSLSLVAVGPGLAMFHFVDGNLGLAQVKTGLGFAPAATCSRRTRNSPATTLRWLVSGQ